LKAVHAPWRDVYQSVFSMHKCEKRLLIHTHSFMLNLTRCSKL